MKSLLIPFLFLKFLISTTLYAGSYGVSGDRSLFHKQIILDAAYEKYEVSSFLDDEVTLFSEEQAQSLFRELSKIDYMKFDYLHDGCFARAQEFSLIGKENGIEMGKVFLSDREDSPSLYPVSWQNEGARLAPIPYGFMGWKYHVAVYILVNIDGKDIPYILDVGVADKAIPLKKWVRGLGATEETHQIKFRDRGYIFADSRHPMGDYSNIAGQLRDQELIREMGISEFLFQRESGWL
ncbi:MAG: hypothetical protein CME63_01305 [Halobacteriovoraceae bacterium]|nr:hypothetical protein [Halobacteriovoraceae bacterium]|tara:strand:+ start:186 stop:899 length:714 start_codon:yes stop_codon:yes gene_type:complete